eukprot:2106589-Rhodomonas_salina.1
MPYAAPRSSIGSSLASYPPTLCAYAATLRLLALFSADLDREFEIHGPGPVQFSREGAKAFEGGSEWRGGAVAGGSFRSREVMSAIGLRACYAMSGTAGVCCYVHCLRTCYAMSGTELAFAISVLCTAHA